MLKVTHIAVELPNQARLQLLAEVGILDNMPGVEITRVTGPRVTRDEVAIALRKATDVVVFSGHGEPGKLLLLDGKVSANWFATQMRAGAPRLAVIAACGSDVAGERLSSITTVLARRGINTIGFPVGVKDTVASTYIVELIRALVAEADVGSAHEVAIEMVGGDEAMKARGIELRAGLMNGYRELIDRMDAYDARLGRIETAVNVLVEHFSSESKS